MRELLAVNFYPAANLLGEGPMWHAERKTCFWVDINRHSFFEYSPQSKHLESWVVDGPVSLVVEGIGDELFLGVHEGVSRFHIPSGTSQLVTDLERNWENHRCNDGAVDCMGRLWVGTTDRDHIPNGGTLYCVEKDSPLQEKITNVTISNGMVWSPDNKYLYFIDTVTSAVSGYHFDPGTGKILFDKVVVRIPESMGFPDGMTIDEEGMLWIALWGGFGVGRWNPADGKLLEFVKVPAPHVSSCVFMGENLNELLISTARKNMSAEDILRFPQSGDLFSVRTHTRGLKAFQCLL